MPIDKSMLPCNHGSMTNGTKQVCAGLPDDLHRKLKVKLAQEGLTIQSWIEQQAKAKLTEKKVGTK